MSPRPSPSTVVLEVSPRTAKMMAATASPFRIQRVNASTLPEQTEDSVTALRALLEAQSLGVHEVGLLFGREIFSLRTLELPSTDVKEITSMLELQLGKLTPYPRAEILSAWAVIGSFRDGYTSVLLAIARKTLIEDVLRLLKSKGITPRWAGVSTEGLEAWLAAAKPNLQISQGQLVVLIDIDFASTDCAVLSTDGRLLFTQSIGIGYDQLNAGDQAALRFIGELIRLPRILLHEDVKGKIGRGLITGAVVRLESVVDQLKSQWGVAVDVLDTLESFAPLEVKNRAKATHVSYAALAGVVASNRSPRIDLIPHETRVSQALQVRAGHLARLATSVAAVLALTAILCGEWGVILSHNLTQLQRQLSTIEKTSNEVLRRQGLMRKVRGWLDPVHSPLEVFRSVSAAADPQVTITQLTMDAGKPVVIRGRTDTMAEVFAFADRLKQQGTFTAITVRPVLKPKGVNSLGVEFEMSCEFRRS